ncbi:hypothetical protein AB4456_23840 [Vibrio splendidus]
MTKPSPAPVPKPAPAPKPKPPGVIACTDSADKLPKPINSPNKK